MPSYCFSGLVDKVPLILLSYIFQSLDVQLYVELLVPAPVPSRTLNTWILGLISSLMLSWAPIMQTWILVFVSLAWQFLSLFPPAPFLKL